MVAKFTAKFITLFGLLLAATHAAADHPTVAFGSEATGAINTIPAEPVPQGKWGVGIRTETIDNKIFGDEQLEGFAAQGLEGVHSADKITNTSNFNCAWCKREPDRYRTTPLYRESKYKRS